MLSEPRRISADVGGVEGCGDWGGEAVFIRSIRDVNGDSGRSFLSLDVYSAQSPQIFSTREKS